MQLYASQILVFTPEHIEVSIRYILLESQTFMSDINFRLFTLAKLTIQHKCRAISVRCKRTIYDFCLHVTPIGEDVVQQIN